MAKPHILEGGLCFLEIETKVNRGWPNRLRVTVAPDLLVDKATKITPSQPLEVQSSTLPKAF